MKKASGRERHVPSPEGLERAGWVRVLGREKVVEGRLGGGKWWGALSRGRTVMKEQMSVPGVLSVGWDQQH